MKYKILEIHKNDALFKHKELIGKVGSGTLKEATLDPDYLSGMLHLHFKRLVTTNTIKKNKAGEEVQTDGPPKFAPSTELIYFRGIKVEKAGN